MNDSKSADFQQDGSVFANGAETLLSAGPPNLPMDTQKEELQIQNKDFAVYLEIGSLVLIEKNSMLFSKKIFYFYVQNCHCRPPKRGEIGPL